MANWKIAATFSHSTNTIAGKARCKIRANRRLKRANSFHDDVTRSTEGKGEEIFPNLLYSFSNVTVLKSFHLAFCIPWPLRFLRKFLSSTLYQTFLILSFISNHIFRFLSISIHIFFSI